jgi:chaperonin GroES
LTLSAVLCIFEAKIIVTWRKEMKVRPLADRVLVKLEKNEAKTASGIIIPDTAQEKTQQGVVVEVGPGTEKDKITVKSGDKVMYDKYAGTQIKVNGEDHLVLKMADIIAVVEG